MIRINLLPHKKKARSAPIEGEKTIAIGMGILMAAAAAVFFLLDSPASSKIEEQQNRNSRLGQENKKIEDRIKNFDELKAAFQSAKTQAVAIEALNNARATPAHFLNELATILRLGGQPTVTTAMSEDIDGNENLQWQKDWDPKHVWVESIKEKGGIFSLLGAAQSDGDVTQLAHRLSASVYFDEVQPEGSSKSQTSAGGVTIYKFKITGKVRY